MKIFLSIFSILLLIGNSSTLSFAQQETISPFKQYQTGQEEITCKHGLQTITKIEDGSPACVTSSTFTKLILRQWGQDPKKEWWSISQLNDTYKTGKRIDFTINFRGLVWCCMAPNVTVSGSDGKMVWHTGQYMCSCPSFSASPPTPTNYYALHWNVNELGFGTLVMNQTGQYSVNAEGLIKNFTVIP